MSNKEKYTAIHELDRKLTELGISHEILEAFDGWLVCVPENPILDHLEGDAIQHKFSYGSKNNLLEVAGFGMDEPKGFLTVDEALKYFVK
jgi:hypothetical protein